jgi:predicted DNA-binding transcriptional regulator AlpA
VDDSNAPSLPAIDALLDLLREGLAPAPELLTRDSFAELLAMGKSTFDRLRETGAIGPSPMKLAGLKWHRDEVLLWLEHRDNNGELHDSKSWPAVREAIRRRTGSLAGL